MTALAGWLARARDRVARITPLDGLGLVMLLGYGAVLIARASLVAGGSDSSGYLASARLLASFRLAEAIPALAGLNLAPSFARAFVPLGFTLAPAGQSMVASYPPGLPLQMAAASLLTGSSTASFYVSELSALACLVLIRMLGREVGLGPKTSMAAAGLLALCPSFLFFAVQPMSDVNATFWCLLAMLGALRAARTRWSALLAGGAYGMAVLVRPSNLLLLVPVLVALPWRRQELLKLILGSAPFAAFLFWYDFAAHGHPLRTGYGSIGALLAWGNFPARFAHYSQQLLLQLSPLVPWAAAAFLFAKTHVPVRRRMAFAAWFLVFFGFYCFYQPYETWWYLRFLLPATPALIVGSLALWEEARGVLLQYSRQLVRPIAWSLLAAAGALQLFQLSDYRVLSIREGQVREYVDTTSEAARLLPSGSLVLAMQTSGALHYYTPELQAVRWDQLDWVMAFTLARRLASQGKPLYALLFPFEIEQARSRFPGAQWTKLRQIGDIGLFELRLPA